MRLEVVGFAGPLRWRWRLTEPDGAVIAEHEVVLDATCWQYEAMCDLHEYLRLRAAPDRRLVDEARIVHLVGRWIGAQVFGAVGTALVMRAPAAVDVVLPGAAQVVALYPLESAIVDGAMLAVRGVGLVFGIGRASRSAKRPIGDRLRILGLFSAPDGASALDLRKERYELARLMKRMAAAHDLALELKVLQYGVTRELLRDVVEDVEGWDVLHLSGHGTAGAVLLERPDGSPDLVTTGDLVALLEPMADQMKLVTLSTCSSAAPGAAEQLRLLGLDHGGDEAGEASAAGEAGPVVVSAAAMALADRLECAVLAMRYPVTSEFAVDLAASVYEQVIGGGRSLPGALARALPALVTVPPTAGRPALSVATPAIFSPPGAATTVHAPSGSYHPAHEAAGLPELPERFVGRVSVMAGASAALAPQSGVPGVVLHGMAGAGKTTCALELAHTHADTFSAFVWFTAPAEGADISDALPRFVAALETVLPDVRLVHLLDEEERLEQALSMLAGIAEHARVLVVVDNAESLLGDGGDWQDPRWGRVLHAFAARRGRSKLIVTTRRSLRGTELHVAAVHALSRDEAVLLARDLPPLRALMDGRAPGLSAGRGRTAAARVLTMAQGHPKLLELAAAHADDLDSLNALLADAGTAWEHRAARLGELFTHGGTVSPDEGFTAVLTAWTSAIAGRLPEPERIFLQFLCALEEEDRTNGLLFGVLPYAWPATWRRVDLPGQAPDSDALLRSLARRALIAITENPANGKVAVARVHPLIAATIVQQSPPGLRAAADTEAADYWSSLYRASQSERLDEENNRVAFVAAACALPYLMRTGRLDDARFLLAVIMNLNPTPAMVATLLPFARRLVTATAGTDDQLLARHSLTRVVTHIDPPAALTELERLLADAVSAGRDDLAYIVAGDLGRGQHRAGRLAEALRVYAELPEYARRAGRGPQVQLSIEIETLQITAAQGRYEQVLTDVEGLLARVGAQQSTGGESEALWRDRVKLLGIGFKAANASSDWERALSYSDRLIDNFGEHKALPYELTDHRTDRYFPLMRLGRTDEALALLRDGREFYENHGDLRKLGAVLASLAAVEKARGHIDTALLLCGDALRTQYPYNDAPAIAVTHHNYGLILTQARDLPAAAAHHLAATILHDLMGSGFLDASIRGMAGNLVSGLAALPATPADLVEATGRTEGVHLDRIVATLTSNPAAFEAAFRRAVKAARDLAAEHHDCDHPEHQPGPAGTCRS
ncbi:CHAT domain-containing protein [Actinomadura sp. NEAU-AAG7]|uniref:CHAT domain-containing protein n=1 Tax=Actinomadura sp. NEAU-AAG7 TaxID=2839640 RepID=UPI001BE422C1|nr:CHAT domain-containing protein [Actinomadura sp. NEAU-AAG7]MBT2212500.1 CHAT domain-containing protein [Actinomadura sp. NEAU-AAG7]